MITDRASPMATHTAKMPTMNTQLLVKPSSWQRPREG